MKKLFITISIAALLISCSNDASQNSSEKEIQKIEELMDNKTEELKRKTDQTESEIQELLKNL